MAAVAAMFIWGGSYVWSSQVFQTLGVGTTILLRLIISSLFLFVIARLTGKWQRVARKDVRPFLLVAFLEPFLYFIGESNGLTRVSPTICSAIIATIPLFAPFGAYIFLREQVTARNIVGFVVSFLGVLCMLIDKNLHFSASPLGLLFLLGAVFSAVCYGIVLRKLTYKYGSLMIVLIENAIGALYFIPFVLLTEMNELSAIARVGDYIVPLLQLGIFASSFAYVFYTYTIGKLGVARANVYANLIPIFTAGFSYVLIGEAITLPKIIGIAIVITGLVLSQLKRRG